MLIFFNVGFITIPPALKIIFKPVSIIKDSLEHLISFSKEFEITPYFVEIIKIVIIYHIVLELTPYEITKYLYNDGNIFDENKNMGKIFTLSKFAIFLLHISILHFEKLNKSLDKKQFK